MKKQIIIIATIVLLVIIGGMFYFYSKSILPITQAPVQQNVAPTTSPKTTINVVPSFITSVVLSSSISKSTTDVKPINPTTVFSSTTKDIFAVLTLKNATQKTQLSYIRYYEGKYVESNVSHPTKIGTKNFYFQWELNAGKTRKIGNYNTVFYVDGIKSLSVNYTITIR
jgi:uncharacterized protein YxeA